MPRTTPLPPELEKKLKALLRPKEEIKFCAGTDMDERMDFGQSWLVATQQRLLVYGMAEGKPGWQILHDLAFKGLGTVEAQSGVGGGTLVAKKGGRSVELLRYSNTLADSFGRLAKALNQLAKQKPAVFPEEPVAARC